jgi:hypothetical protein
MTNNNRMGTEDIAMSRLGAALGPSLAEQLEQRRIQASIDACMRDVIADHVSGRAFNPGRGSNDGPAEKPKGTGWVEPKPLELPPGQEVIERLCDAALPHGKGMKK